MTETSQQGKAECTKAMQWRLDLKNFHDQEATDSRTPIVVSNFNEGMRVRSMNQNPESWSRNCGRVTFLKMKCMRIEVRESLILLQCSPEARATSKFTWMSKRTSDRHSTSLFRICSDTLAQTRVNSSNQILNAFNGLNAFRCQKHQTPTTKA